MGGIISPFISATVLIGMRRAFGWIWMNITITIIHSIACIITFYQREYNHPKYNHTT